MTLAYLIICLAIMSVWHDVYPWLREQLLAFDCQLG